MSKFLVLLLSVQLLTKVRKFAAINLVLSTCVEALLGVVGCVCRSGCEVNGIKESLSYVVAFVQVASSEWVLGVQIQNFTNFFNAELRENMYCCCDIPDTCDSNITEFTSTYVKICTTECNTYFVANLLDYENATSYSTIDTFSWTGISLAHVSSLVFQVPIGSSTPNQVSTSNHKNIQLVK